MSKHNNSSAKLAMSCVHNAQFGETYDIYGSNTLGVPGTKLIAGGTLDLTFFNVPSLGSFKYYSAATDHPDVMVSGLIIQTPSAVPEPSSLALAAVGLGSLVAWLRRRTSRS